MFQTTGAAVPGDVAPAVRPCPCHDPGRTAGRPGLSLLCYAPATNPCCPVRAVDRGLSSTLRGPRPYPSVLSGTGHPPPARQKRTQDRMQPRHISIAAGVLAATAPAIGAAHVPEATIRLDPITPDRHRPARRGVREPGLDHHHHRRGDQASHAGLGRHAAARRARAAHQRRGHRARLDPRRNLAAGGDHDRRAEADRPHQLRPADPDRPDHHRAHRGGPRLVLGGLGQRRHRRRHQHHHPDRRRQALRAVDHGGIFLGDRGLSRLGHRQRHRADGGGRVRLSPDHRSDGPGRPRNR